MNLPLDLVPLLGLLPQLARATPQLWSALAPRKETWLLARMHSEPLPAELFDVCPGLEAHHPRPHAFCSRYSKLLRGGQSAMLGGGVRVSTRGPAPEGPAVIEINDAVSHDGRFTAQWYENRMVVHGEGWRRDEFVVEESTILRGVFTDDGTLYYTTNTNDVKTKRHGRAAQQLVRQDVSDLYCGGNTVLYTPPYDEYIGNFHGDIISRQGCAVSDAAIDATGTYVAVHWRQCAHVVVYCVETREPLWETGAIWPWSGCMSLQGCEVVALCRHEGLFIVKRTGCKRFPCPYTPNDPTFDGQGRLWFMQWEGEETNKRRLMSVLL